MTLVEKREFLGKFCDTQSDCETCLMCRDERGWCHEYNELNAPEDIVDYSISKINGNYKGSASISNVDHPSHYNQGGIECWGAMEAAYGKEAVKTFCKLNAFKYVWRADNKNGMEDINKAINYLNKYKELVEQ